MASVSNPSSVKVDLLIRANRIHTLQPGQSIQRALAVCGGRIWALSEEAHGLDAYIGPETHVIEKLEATVLPAFDDTHTHLVFAGLSQFDVPVHKAHDIEGILRLLRERAAQTKPGQLITTTANWQEFNLREQRLPTRQELDSVTTDHPILVKRGGHNVVANSYAFTLCGITPETQSPRGGHIGRDEQGRLDGLLQDSAIRLVDKIKPTVTLQSRIDGLEGASASYAATGIGCARDCLVSLDDLAAFKATNDAGKLHVRVRALISAIGISNMDEMDQLLSKMEPWRHLQTDPWLSIWGVKFAIDGGIEACATEEPYANAGSHECSVPVEFRGSLLWEPGKLFDAMDMVLRRGWRIGTHAFGDRAVRILLDVYERLLQRYPYLQPGTLVMEHGGLATADQRSRAVALNIPVTIQQPLLHDIAGIEAVYLGEERVSRMFPARAWLDEGAIVTGGSDYPVGIYGPMRSIWGMTSRQTVTGVKGFEHAITPTESVALHTTLAAKMLSESNVRGCLTPGRFADITVWPIDPLTVGDVQYLRDLSPLYTILGGQIKHAQREN